VVVRFVDIGGIVDDRRLLMCDTTLPTYMKTSPKPSVATWEESI